MALLVIWNALRALFGIRCTLSLTLPYHVSHSGGRAVLALNLTKTTLVLAISS